MDAAAITSNLDEIVTNRRTAQIVVEVGEPLDQQATFTLGADGYEADVQGTVDQALSAGRNGPFGSVASHVRAALGQRTWTIPLQGESVDANVDTFLEDLAAEVDREPTAGDVAIDPDTLEVTVEEPVEGYQAEVDEVRSQLEELAGTGEDASLTLPVTTLPPVVDPANVEEVAERARGVLSEGYVLVSGEDSITVDPSQVVGVLSIDRGDDGYALSIDADGVVGLIEDRGERFEVAPKSAGYEVEEVDRTFDDKGSATFDPSPANVSVVEGSTGRAFNPEVAAARLVELFEAGEHRGEFELDVVEPDFTTEEAQAGKPDALLGTFTTYHDAGGDRVFNIHLLADMIDGEVLPPGDDFSVNRDIGDRTEEKGFRPAGAIIDGELVETDIGGGVSQLATTFYNAAFFSGIELISWKPHSWPISRYPLAREATFSYAADLDIHIANDTQGALVVKTSYTDSSITVSIYGQDDGREVTAEMGEPRDYTDWDVVERPSDEVCQGQSRTVQTGAQGFSVDYRRIIEGGTNPGTQDFSWAYSPKDTIIENGTRSC
nr:VanW family protein [Salsipaludibacter albus]